MWKAPHRPGNDVTQQYNDGVVDFYAVENIAEPGYKPKEGLKFKERLYFETLRAGIDRIYAGKQNQAEIESVIRVQKRDTISSQDVAVLNNGKQYGVETVQDVTDVWPPSMDVTLKRIEQKYEIPKKGGESNDSGT